jgi:hypothetical protein
MNEIPFLKLVPPAKKEGDPEGSLSGPLNRLKGVVLNVTESALDCLNRVSQQEAQKKSPSPNLMEEYFLLHHYLDFIRRLCEAKKDSSSQNLSEELLLLHESMHFE